MESHSARNPPMLRLCWQGCTRGGGGKESKFTTKIVDTIVVNVLRYLTFSQNQPLKSADDKQIGVLRDTRQLDIVI